MAKTTSSTGYEPNVIDNSDYSETHTAIFQNESVDINTEPSSSFDAELDDELIKEGQSSQLFTQEQEEPANLRQTLPFSWINFCYQLSPFFTRTSTERPVYEPSSNLSQKRKSSRELENKKNQDSSWKTKRANSCWSQIWYPEARTSSRVWQKYPGTKWKYWYYCKMWAIQARSITTRRNIRTKSGSSWNLYQEYARHWRIAEKSRVKGRGAFKKKIDWRLWGSNFILPGLECQDSLHLWRQRREAPRCWDWRRAHQEFAGFTTVPSGARSKCELVAGSLLAKEKACFKVHRQF